MAFALNTKSGYLHLDDHGGDSDNVEEFERADEADRFAFDSGLSLTFCKQCFPDNINTLVAEEEERLTAENEAAGASKPAKAPASDTGSPTEFTRPAGDTSRGPDTLDDNTTL